MRPFVTEDLSKELDHEKQATDLCRLRLNLQLWDDELDGAALNEDGEEDDEQGGGEEDVLERVVLVQDGDQGEADSTAKTTVGQNKLFLQQVF